MHRTRHPAPGTAPATLIAPEQAHPPTIRLIEYDRARVVEKEITSFEEILPCRDNEQVSWIDIGGLADVELLRKIGQHFNLHPLALEDVLNLHQRPKIEEYADHLFIVSQMVFCDDECLEEEQVSIFFGRRFVFTIQEEPKRDVFDLVRARLRKEQSKMRSLGPDYLVYALLDAMVDHYFPVLESLGNKVEALEEQVLEQPTRDSMMQLHEVKRMLLRLRRSAWPEREVVNVLCREENELIQPETKVFLRDCYDHTIQIMDIIESYRDLTAGLMDLYVSALGMRTNEIMRVLTVVTTIFIPLTFIAGVYGMNFENMPELHTRSGYYVVMAFMALIAAAMVYYFRRKKWL